MLESHDALGDVKCREHLIITFGALFFHPWGNSLTRPVESPLCFFLFEKGSDYHYIGSGKVAGSSGGTVERAARDLANRILWEEDLKPTVDTVTSVDHVSVYEVRALESFLPSIPNTP